MAKISNARQVEGCQAQVQHINEQKFHEAYMNESVAHPSQALFVTHDEMMFFYNGNDCSKMIPADMQKVRELQDSNDKLQRQIAQLDKELKQSNDALTILGERERLLIIVARNTGEILKMHVENTERLSRIAELEQQNILLQEEMILQRNKFIDTHELEPRTKHAADFFLTKSKIERNFLEIVNLTQE